ncbi:hypothetical protein LXL04_026691 [Taraxacum kok-saghyz]
MSEFYAAETATTATVRSQTEYMKGNEKKIVETNINQAWASIQTGVFDNPLVYTQTCTTLGSTIDSAIATNAVPSSSHLPQLHLIVREVYRLMAELQQPSLMLLMLPIKAACKVGWFPDGVKADLLMMADKVCSMFSDTDKMRIEPSYVHSCVPKIILRFYPTMKVETILTSFNVKAGYGTFVVDFHISQGTLPRQCRNLWLLVARMDNMETAACIASPSNVNFLINGSEVPRRTKSNMGKGPQLPSNVTKMIKYGVNLLQVLGDFDGDYVIAVAFMNMKLSPDLPPLQNYVHTIKLRIRTPVKGYLCKHPQCFDYKYFMEVNSRWPTWNCPICNKPILNEVSENIRNVIISADGSWTVANVGKGITEIAESTTVVTPNVGTTREAQSTTMHTPPSTSSPCVVEAFDQLMKGGEQWDCTGPGQSQPVGPSQSQHVEIERPESLPSGGGGGVMPVGRMRGSLKGDQLAAARERLLAPPRQPVRANEPWSRPTPTLPIALLMQQKATNSNTVNVPNIHYAQGSIPTARLWLPTQNPCFLYQLYLLQSLEI